MLKCVQTIVPYYSQGMMTLTKDKLIVFANNILPLPTNLWREEKMSCGIPGNYQLTSEMVAIPSLLLALHR